MGKRAVYKSSESNTWLKKGGGMLSEVMVDPRAFFKLMKLEGFVLYSNRQGIYNGIQYETMIPPTDIPGLVPNEWATVINDVFGSRDYSV